LPVMWLTERPAMDLPGRVPGLDMAP
jgi:hypothetical protein